MNVLAATPGLDLGTALADGATGVLSHSQAAITAAVPVLIAIVGITVALKLWKRFVKG